MPRRRLDVAAPASAINKLLDTLRRHGGPGGLPLRDDAALAAALKVSRSTLSRWRAGHPVPDVAMMGLRARCYWLGVPAVVRRLWPHPGGMELPVPDYSGEYGAAHIESDVTKLRRLVAAAETEIARLQALGNKP